MKSYSRNPLCTAIMASDLTFDSQAMLVKAYGQTVPVIEINGIAWFRAKDCATIMDYEDQKKAIKAHVDVLGLIPGFLGFHKNYVGGSPTTAAARAQHAKGKC